MPAAEAQTPPSATSSVAAGGKTRAFKFTYGAVLQNIKPGKRVKVWLPVAPTNHDQDVKLLQVDVGGEYQETLEKRYGNKLIFFEAVADDKGEVPIEAVYLVKRRELTKANLEAVDETRATDLEENKMVPTSDQLRDRVLAAAGATVSALPASTLEKARTLYEGVDNHMKYNKPADIKGWGKGDAVWACDSQFGNCTDFHSLFISSARNLKIPSRFEIGFPISTGATEGPVGGYHCWAKFSADGKWMPVDISEADKHQELKDYYFGNLTADRVTFSTGRDLKLVPENEAGPVNFLVYPYAEIDGKQHMDFRKQFRFEDVANEAAKH